jgi:hypothetical protein
MRRRDDDADGLMRRLALILIGIVIVSLVVTVPAAARPKKHCAGVRVPAGADLQMLDDGQGQTYCLRAGTYSVPSEIRVDDGDVIKGAGTRKTFIIGTGARNMFSADSGAVWAFRKLDISGAVGDASCAPDCGRAFLATGEQLTLRKVRCHDNENQCIGSGAADVIMKKSECDHNGNLEFVSFTNVRSTACIKRVRGASSSITTVIQDSYIHDNIWIGLWFDFYEGAATIEHNVITSNGKAGIGWEVSGGFNPADNIVVRGNKIRGNGHAGLHPIGGGVICNTCADALIESNVFGGNSTDAVRFVDSGREWGVISNVIIRNNKLKGDRLSCPSGVTKDGGSCAR